MIEVQQGRITVDGIDISTINHTDIRASINTIPQDAFFVPGTVRLNLDPYNRASAADIESALTKVGLWDKIGNLDEQFSGEEWSMGQRQLLALAMAILVKSPILILDEATSRYVPIRFCMMKCVYSDMWSLPVWMKKPSPSCKRL